MTGCPGVDRRPDHLPGAVAACPSFAFDPRDPWTRAFQAGLTRGDLRGLQVYEVGVGTGTNVLHLLEGCGADRVHGSDLDPRLTELAMHHVERAAPRLSDRFRPLPGSVSLIGTPAARAAVASVDVVVACLPQVPDLDDSAYRRMHRAMLRESVAPGHRTDDHLAHYYPWSPFQKHPFNVVGFGLNEALLRQVRTNAPRAEVFLALSCRAGRDVVDRLFTAHGYEPEIVAEHIVRQSDCTNIAFFESLEVAGAAAGDAGFRCEFYADPDGRVGLTAGEARRQVRTVAGTPVYHALRVVRGRPR